MNDLTAFCEITGPDTKRFDYSLVDSTISPRLQTLKQRYYDNFEELYYQQGKIIAEAQELLANIKTGTFNKWIIEELGISVPGAYKLLNIYKNVPENTLKSFKSISASKGIVDIFANPNTPVEVKEFIQEKVESGIAPSLKEVAELKSKLNQTQQENQSLQRQLQEKPKEVIKTETVTIIPSDYDSLKQLKQTVGDVESYEAKAKEEAASVLSEASQKAKINAERILSEAKKNLETINATIKQQEYQLGQVKHEYEEACAERSALNYSLLFESHCVNLDAAITDFLIAMIDRVATTQKEFDLLIGLKNRLIQSVNTIDNTINTNILEG